VAGGTAKRFCEDAAPGPDFENGIGRSQISERDDFTDNVGIDEKILSKTFDRCRRER
jgi:hypothetical protein